MGLFGSRTKTYYSSTSSLLLEQAQGVVEQTVMSSVVQNRNIASDLIGNLTNGIYFDARTFYQYAKNGSYPYGLPEGFTTQLSPQTYNYVRYLIANDIGEDTVHINFVYVDTDPTNGHYIYHASYYLVDGNGHAIPTTEYTWEYDEDTGTYPELAIDKTQDTGGDSPYFPIIPLRLNNVPQNDPSAPYVDETRTACRFLGLDADELIEAIEAQTADTGENPVEDAFVMLGADVTDQNQSAIEYLFRYFSHMEGASPISYTDYLYWDTYQDSGETPPMNNVRVEETNYKMELGWNYITRNVIAGTLVDGVQYTNHYERNGTVTLPDGDTYYSGDVLVLRYQITQTHYEELRVVGLVHSNWAVGHELYTTLSDAFDDPDDNPQSFIIPLRNDILNRMRVTARHDLMYSTIRLVLNDRNKVKLKWYQTGWFRFVTFAIAVCVSVFYPPAWMGAAALTGAAVGLSVAWVITARMLTPFLFKALENLIGEELALLATILAYYYGATPANALKGTFGTGASLRAAGKAATTGITGVMEIKTEQELLETQAELESMQEELDALADEEAARINQVLAVSEATRGDPIGILQANTFVTRTKAEPWQPALLKESVQYFTDMERETGRPDSYIFLGHSGY